MKDQLDSIVGRNKRDVATVSRPELLVDNSDATFRRAIHTLMGIANNVDSLRVSFGQVIGISGPQHELIMLISRVNGGEGIGVGEVAKIIKRTSAFVVMETNQLQKMGLVEKIPSEEDKRRVVLRVTKLAEAKLRELVPFQRTVNDTLFGTFGAKDFLAFIRQLEKLLPASEKACDTAYALFRDMERQKAHERKELVKS